MDNRNIKMKYKEIFKKWWFWLIYAFFMLWGFSSAINNYGSLFTSEIFGVILASSMMTLIFVTLGFWIYKAFYRNRK